MPNISGWERVTLAFAVDGGFTTGQSVSAPSGKKIVGGGFTVEEPELIVMASRPSQDGTAWEVTLHNNATHSINVTIYAVAVNG